MAEADSYRVGGVTVTVDHAALRVTSRWDDGVTLYAVPIFDADSINRAWKLGYRDSGESLAVWDMTADHDLLHHVLADAAGETQGSPHLRRIATAAEMFEAERREGHREECLVMLLHRLRNMGGGALDRYRV